MVKSNEQTTSYVAPRSTFEQELADIWCSLLHRERVGIHDNFFELGGQSLLLADLVSHIRHEFGVDMTSQILFNCPTIVDMTVAITVLQINQEEAAEAARMMRELKSLSVEEIEALLQED